MNIGGVKRTNEGFERSLKTGIFEATVIAVNPTLEQFKDVLGMEVKEDSKSIEYLGEKDGNTTLRIDFWLLAKDDSKFKVSFFLEDRERENKDKTKNQYINSIGSCSWAGDENDLPKWFSDRDYRQAYVGEEELYNFMRIWLSELDYRHAETTLMIDWKKLMKGNVRDIKDQVGGEWSGGFGALATVITKEKEGEVKEYQGVYNKAFLPAYVLKHFKLVDYTNESTLAKLSSKKSSDLKPHERFVLNVTGEYGCKDYYTFSEIQEYNPDDNVAASSEALTHSDDGGEY